MLHSSTPLWPNPVIRRRAAKCRVALRRSGEGPTHMKCSRAVGDMHGCFYQYLSLHPTQVIRFFKYYFNFVTSAPSGSGRLPGWVFAMAPVPMGPRRILVLQLRSREAGLGRCRCRHRSTRPKASQLDYDNDSDRKRYRNFCTAALGRRSLVARWTVKRLSNRRTIALRRRSAKPVRSSYTIAI